MGNKTPKHKTPCTATTRQDQPCRAWALPGTDPPRCAPHGGASAKPGAPMGNHNAVTHGFYANRWGDNLPGDGTTAEFPSGHNQLSNPESQPVVTNSESPETHSDRISKDSLLEIITYITQDLLNKHIALSSFIDNHFDELPLPALSHLLALHAQTATRLGRLLRDQRVMAPELSDVKNQAIDYALDELSNIFGVQL